MKDVGKNFARGALVGASTYAGAQLLHHSMPQAVKQQSHQILHTPRLLGGSIYGISKFDEITTAKDKQSSQPKPLKHLVP